MTKEEYEKRSFDNTVMSGSGLGTTIHSPCPFCAAEDFMVFGIMEVESVTSAGAVCKECKRGCKAINKRTNAGLSFEFVQTCGDDPPDYIPKMRRV